MMMSLIEKEQNWGQDPYEVLGVSPSATQGEIKKAFFDKAKLYHPDVNKGDPTTQKKFVQITAAYEILKDKNKRAQYDSMKQAGFDPSAAWGGAQDAPRRPGGQAPPYGSQGPFGGGYQRQQQNPFQGGQGHEDFMRWYSTTFGDIFKEMDEQMKRSGFPGSASFRGPDGNTYTINYGRRSTRRQRKAGDAEEPPSIFGGIFSRIVQGAAKRGTKFAMDRLFKMFADPWSAMEREFSGNRTKYNISGSDFDLPDSFLVEESRGHISIDFSLTSELGSQLGALIEKFLDAQRGSVLTYSLDGKTVAKARRWTKADGMERMIIEDSRSHRIASIEQTIPLDVNTAMARIRAVVTKDYNIFDAFDHQIATMSVADGITKSIKLIDMKKEVVAEVSFSSTQSYDPNKPNLDKWSVQIHPNNQLDPSIVMFAAAFNSIRRRRVDPFIPATLKWVTQLFQPIQPTPKRTQ